jgi:hypothetical protein
MAKFVVVNEAPKTLEKGEMLIEQPTFLAEIEANSRKAGSSKLTGISHIREVLNSIAEKYDPEMSALRIPLVNYVGIAYENNNDLSAIITRILKNHHPVIFDKYLTYKLNTKLIYYVGNLTTTTPFYQSGLDLLDEKDIDSYMTGKPKKIVGKPAITNEEAKINGSQ